MGHRSLRPPDAAGPWPRWRESADRPEGQPERLLRATAPRERPRRQRHGREKNNLPRATRQSHWKAFAGAASSALAKPSPATTTQTVLQRPDRVWIRVTTVATR